jgi:hypothetical protein
MRMAPALTVALATLLCACSREPSIPDKPSDDPSARTTTIHNPPQTPQAASTACDVPMYPGAKAPDGMSRMPRVNQDGSTTYNLVLTTNDTPQKVADFYSNDLKIAPVKTDIGLRIMGKTPKKNDAIVTIESEAGETVVRISSIAYANQ